MCKICGFLYCPPGCPQYNGEWEGSGHAVAHCTLCEDAIREGERAYVKEELTLCGNCMRELELDQLLYLCAVSDTEELLCDCLGWERRRFS